MNIIRFKYKAINIELILPVTLTELFRYDYVKVILKLKNKSYLLSNEFAITTIQAINRFLEKALTRDVSLNYSLEEDIGFLWNEDLYSTARESIENYVSDIIDPAQYIVWSSSDKYETWIYIKNEKIFFEVSSVYPWNFENPKTQEEYFSYDEYIKNYKPEFIAELNDNIIKKWLKKIISILKQIEDNDKLYECKGNGCFQCHKETNET